MNADQWPQMIEYATYSTWTTVSDQLPGIIGAILILILGFILGGVAKGIIMTLTQTLHVDDAFAQTGARATLDRAGVKVSIGKILGSLVKWFVVIVAFVVALDLVNLGDATQYLSTVILGYLPRVLVATIIIFGAVIIAQFVERIITASSTLADFSSPALLGKFAKYAIIFTAVLAALNELQIAEELIQMLFAGLVFGLSLALGLSFGLGGKDAAGRYIDRKVAEKSTRLPR